MVADASSFDHSDHNNHRTVVGLESAAVQAGDDNAVDNGDNESVADNSRLYHHNHNISVACYSYIADLNDASREQHAEGAMM